MNFVEKVHELFTESNMTQRAFAEKAQIKPATLNAILRRKTANISVSTAQKIANATGVTLDYLMRDEIIDRNYGRKSDVEASYEEGKLLKMYRQLDARAQGAIRALLDYEWKEAQKNGLLGASDDTKNRQKPDHTLLSFDFAGLENADSTGLPEGVLGALMIKDGKQSPIAPDSPEWQSLEKAVKSLNESRNQKDHGSFEQEEKRG